jgi:hypothetical protein
MSERKMAEYGGNVAIMQARISLVISLEERARLEALQQRYTALFRNVSLSEMIGAGIQQLQGLTNEELSKVLDPAGGQESSFAS